MFPILIRIPNPRNLLRPGMNTKVEIHIGEREDAPAIPTAALRSERDLAMAANVVGLPLDTIHAQLARARGETPTAAANTVTMFGRQIPLPEGVTAEQVQDIMAKMRSGGGPQSLNEEERQVFAALRRAGGGGNGPGGQPGGNRGGRQRGNTFQYGGEFVVFVVRNGAPVATPIRTGMTDLEYAAVQSGLEVGDTVLVLPSTSLLQSQEQMQEWMNRRMGGLPGIGR